MDNEHRVVSLCFAGRRYWQEDFVGSLYECRRFVALRAKHGRHTATTHITRRSFDDWKRLNPAE